jgi:hypothetical protein
LHAGFAVSDGMRGVSVRQMESDTKIRDADLELLLAEADREEPFLHAPRRPQEDLEPREEIDEQILAGLVTP